MDSPPVPGELLVDIFLRLSNPADLVRASAACVSLRRLVADRSFLRQYRKLHAPPLLGLFDGTRDFHPVIAPYPSASAARAVSLAADFRFSFPPAPACAWDVQDIQDIRDGRILLHSAATDEAFFTEMVVCDPLYRRYLLLPPIPDDLAASLEDLFALERKFWCEMFLTPPGDDEETSATEGTSFRVIWMAHCRTKLIALVFSSCTGQWRAIPSFAGLPSIRGTLFRFRQYSHGLFYWRAECGEDRYMLVLDTRMMEFSFAEPPPEAKSSYTSAIGMVEAGESRPGMFVLKNGESDLGYSMKQNDGGSSGEWQKEKTISLGPDHCLICSTERYLLLYEVRRTLHESGFYTLDIKTFQLEKMFKASVYSFSELRAYSNFPPSILSLPKISSGKLSITF